MTSRVTSAVAIALVSLYFVSAAPISAALSDYYQVEASWRFQTTDCLSKDWQGKQERFGGVGLTGKLYPVSVLELTGGIEGTGYSSVTALSNAKYTLGFKLVPTPSDFKTTFFFSGSVQYQSFMKSEGAPDTTGTVELDPFNLSDYPGRTGDLLASVQHELLPYARIRGGIQFKLTSWDVNGLHDKYEHQVFLGTNLSLPGSNTLDLEIGYRFGDYWHLADRETRHRSIKIDTAGFGKIDDNLEWFYFSPRFSRPIGARNGVSITYLHREFTGEEPGAFVWGNTMGIVSPWAGDYEGDAVTLSLKTFAIPRINATASVGYADKSFLPQHDPFMDTLDTEAFDPHVATTLFVKDGRADRQDFQTRATLTLSYPIRTAQGYYVEPSLTVSHVTNHSSRVEYFSFEYQDELYERYRFQAYSYHDNEITLELKVRL